MSTRHRKIKVAYFMNSFDTGGVERDFVKLVRGLDRRRYAPIAFTFHRKGAFLKEVIDGGVEVTEVAQGGRPYSLHGLRQILRFAKVLRDEKPHILQSFHFYSNVFSIPAAVIAGIPVKIAAEQINDRYEAHHFRKRRFWMAAQLVYRLADGVMVNCRATKRYLMYQHGIESTNKVRVIDNAVDMDSFRQPCSLIGGIRKDLGLSEDIPVIGIVGRLAEQKDHQTFLRAMRAVCGKYPSVRALVVGDGILRDELEELSRTLGVASNVAFLGHRGDIPRLLSAMDVVVLSSVREGAPNVILEAMAAGKPVVATDVGGVAELVVHGKTGLVIPPRNPVRLAQAIISLLEDEDKAREMGCAARKRAEDQFSVSRMVVEMGRFYEELLESKGIC